VYAIGLKDLKAAKEKKFTIPFRPSGSSSAPTSDPSPSKDGRIRNFGLQGAEIEDGRAHAINRELVCSRVVHDAALADVFPARFELRLH
jgi:hypothetical protein